METHQSCRYFLHDCRTSSKRITCIASIRMAETHKLNPNTDRSKRNKRKRMRKVWYFCLLIVCLTRGEDSGVADVGEEGGDVAEPHRDPVSAI